MMLIIYSIMGGIMIVAGVFMLTGRGSFMIAGYNNMPQSEKEKYDEKALCRFIGKIIIPLGILMIMAGIDRFTQSWGFWPVWATLFVGLLVLAVVYPNTGNRFRK